MALALTLLACRQNPAQSTVVNWGGPDPAHKSLLLLVARRKLEPGEIDQALGGAVPPDADVVKVPAGAAALVDDLTPGGEPRYYGVAGVAADGHLTPLRFRAGSAVAPEGAVRYSALGGKALAAAAPAAAAPAPAAPVRGPFAASPAPAAPVRGPFAAAAPAESPIPAPAAPLRGPFAAARAPSPEVAPAAPAGPTRGPFAGTPAAEPEPVPVAPAGPTRGPFAATPAAEPEPEPVATRPTRGPFAAAPAAEPEPAPTRPTRGPFAASPAAEPEPAPTRPTRGPFAAAPEEPPAAPAPSADAVDARRQAQLRAQQAAAAAITEPPPVAREPEAAPAADPREARRQAQLRAQQATAGGETAAAAPARTRAPVEEKVEPPSAYPVDRFGLSMTGAMQSWDGLRILWEDERKAAVAWEVIIADHPLEADEAGELLRGEPVQGAFVRALPRAARAVIDNRTDRDARMYCAVLARLQGGAREAVGAVAQSSDDCRVLEAPFVDPDRLDEVRDLANGQVREARAQLHFWESEQDVSAWREALRVVSDALAIYPGFPPAVELKAQIQAARQV